MLNFGGVGAFTIVTSLYKDNVRDNMAVCRYEAWMVF
jgi:hypothetical protein